MGHEYCGVVEDVGRAVTSVKPGQFVIGSFFTSDNTCPHCRIGYGCGAYQGAEKGVGADSVLECVGTQESTMQAILSTRRGGSIGYVRVPHGVALDGARLFFTHVRLHGGPAPVRRYQPDLVDRVLQGKINPGKVFDLTLPLARAAEGYRAMDERRSQPAPHQRRGLRTGGHRQAAAVHCVVRLGSLDGWSSGEHAMGCARSLSGLWDSCGQDRWSIRR